MTKVAIGGAEAGVPDSCDAVDVVGAAAMNDQKEPKVEFVISVVDLIDAVAVKATWNTVQVADQWQQPYHKDRSS